MLDTLIIGASGYVGIELVKILNKHPYVNIKALLVSEKSHDIGKPISDLYFQLKGILDLPLYSLGDVVMWTHDIDVVFLATDHKVSHDIAPIFLEAGCVVFDLSGAFRVNNFDFYVEYYSFSHQHPEWLKKAVYGLAEWAFPEIQNAQLIAVPGCYPTLSVLALKPLIDMNLIDKRRWPVINAISGVSGVGRKLKIESSFCEVSLRPYSIFNHRHSPEIIFYLGTSVIFIPHIGNFSRGILATITCSLNEKVSYQDIYKGFHEAYDDKSLIRLYKKGIPALKNVVGLPYCDIAFFVKGENLVLVVAEDNLMKGAASQAVQCLNLRYGFPETESLF